MAMIRSDVPPVFFRLQELYCRERFENAHADMTPPFPIGSITIDGKFDRYFDRETQAAWEGWQEAHKVAVRFHSRLLQFQHMMADCAAGLREYQE